MVHSEKAPVLIYHFVYHSYERYIKRNIRLTRDDTGEKREDII